MTKKINGSWRRIAALFVIILIIATSVLSLSSCKSSSNKIEEKEEDQSDIKYAAYVISTNAEQMSYFIAASRGYDMKAEDFDDSKIDPGVIKEPDVEAAKAALAAVIENSKFENSDSKTFLNTFKEELDAEKVREVAEAMKTSCDTENDPGFFDYILIGIGAALKWMTKIFGQQYIIAIMVFALIVEILMLPVSIKQQKNSIGMAKLRPKIMKIEKKYAGRTDQATLRKKQEEIMELQKNEGYSPFSGCLPLLLQLVIVGFILYPIIQNPLHYMLNGSDEFSQTLMSYATSPRAIGGLGLEVSSKGNAIEILSILNSENIENIKTFSLLKNGNEVYDAFMNLDIPNFKLFGLNLGKVPKILDILVIIPILNVVVQWVSMRLSRKWMGTANPAAAGGDNSQMNASMKMMDFMMPLMTLFIMFQVPALIGVYWLFRSGVSLLKQYIIKRAMPIPKYSEEELKEMEKIEKDRQKAEKAIIKSQPKYRSLHYIDEDDYEELPEIKSSGKSENSKTISSDRPEIKD